MSDQPHDCGQAVPLFSVIIPLESHRNRWEKCLDAWRAQKLDGSQFELVLVVPPTFPERDRLTRFVAANDDLCQVVESDLTHDIALCAVGAEHARGQFLFFTESHCWPEPGVLALCLGAFEHHSDWAGLSCRSIPVASGRLARAEGEMYEADILYGTTVHPWRKILDQCFVSRRDAYEKCGGFNAEFGHFAEWALAANYHALGLTLGYLPKARFSHQYLGDLKELRAFSLDFVRGQVAYLAGAVSEPGSHLIELPDEWIARGSVERPLARALFRQSLWAMLGAMGFARRGRHLSTTLHWLAPAILGGGVRRTQASLGEAVAYVRLRAAVILGSSRTLNEAFKRYQTTVIHRQRLSIIAHAHTSQARAQDAGLHLTETLADGTTYRWSEPSAVARIEVPEEASAVVIDSAPIFSLLTIADLKLWLDGKRIADGDLLIDPHRITIKIHVDGPRSSILGWTCSRFAAPNDPRVLGMPVADIRVVATT